MKTIFDKKEDKDGWHYVRNEIIDRISDLAIDCPECESIIYDDAQYQCGTCGGGAKINVLNWVKKQVIFNEDI
jgi:ribosomal protein L37E